MKNQLKKHERKTPAILTLFEKSEIIGARAVDLQKPPHARAFPIQLTMEELNALASKGPREIAECEFNKGKLPMQIRRVHADGSFELWDLSELRFVKT